MTHRSRLRDDGVALGRPKGKMNAQTKYKLCGKEELITDLLMDGVSKSKIARLCGVSRNTLDRYLRNFMAELTEATNTTYG